MKRILMMTLAVVAIASLASAQTPAASPVPGAKAAGTAVGPNYVDANGDGICDNYQAGGRGQGAGQGRGYGPGNGAGNQGMGPRDGSGYGPGSGTGACDGTGPKGQGRRGGPRR